MMDSSLQSGNSTASACQKTKRRAINKTNGAAPTRNLLRRVINNLSSSQGANAKALPSPRENEAAPKATTKHPNFSNHISKNQIKIDDDDDEFRNNKRNEAEYSYATVNSINYEPLHVKRNNAVSANIRSDFAIIGHAPKTLPILQALNELKLSADVNVRHDGNEEKFPPVPENYKVPERPEPAPRTSVECPTRAQDKGKIRKPEGKVSTARSLTSATTARNVSQKAGEATPVALPGTRRYLKHSRASRSPRRNLIGSNDNKRNSAIPGKVHKTPSWISKIFQFTRNGRLDLLKEAVYGLDLTLIRHLVDAKGNNLLHCSGRKGHIHILEWLVSILGDQFEAALNDQNANGSNVILTSLKNSQLTCLQWLIINTITGSNALTAKDGKRSLLHYAAKYNLVDAARLLCEFHVRYQIMHDIQDSSFCTPLHIAAKFGNINVAQVLIQFGADPSCQTELGCKPSDLALRHHHIECVAYFRMAEAAATLGNDLGSLMTQFNTLQAHFETLRTHFRDVLRVGKCLTKERNELIKHFPFVGSKSSPEETAAATTALLLGGTTNNGVRFSDLEHKLVQAEHVWKQIETRQAADAGSSLLRSSFQRDELCSSPNITRQSFLLQKYLADMQPVLQRSRHSSDSVLLDVESSSSEDSFNCGESSEDDDDVFDEEGLSEPTYHNIAQCHLNKAKSCSYLPPASSNTPWLLPSSETSILSSLSSHGMDAEVSPMLNLDLLGKSPLLKKSPDFVPRIESMPVKNSSFTSSSSIGVPVTPGTPKPLKLSPAGPENGNEEAASAAAVIEVIEPVCIKPTKSTSSSPSNSKSKQTPSSNNTPSKLLPNNGDGGHGMEKLSGDWISADNSILAETGSGGSLSCAIANEMLTYEDKKSTGRHETGNFAVPLIQANTKETKEASESSQTSQDVEVYEDSTPFLGNQIHHSPKPKRRPRRREVENYGDSFPATVSKLEMRFPQSKERCNQIAQSTQCHTLDSCDTCGNVTSSSCTCLDSPALNMGSGYPTVVSIHSHSTNNDKLPSRERSLVKVPVPQLRNSISAPQRNEQHQSTFSNRLTAFPGPEIRFPVSHSPQRKPADHSDRAAGASSSITHVSFVQPSSAVPAHPSVSDAPNIESSSTRPEWPMVDLPQCSPLECARSLNGHQSPSPSETESALAPPPSQVSQSSDTSKTESVRGQRITTAMLAPEDGNPGDADRDSNSIIINYCQIVTSPAKSAYDSRLKMMSGRKREGLVDRDKGSCDNQRLADDKIDNNETRESSENGVGCSVVQSSITEAVKTTHSTPTISLNASTEPIHNNNNKEPIKNLEQPKPWYEVEMSDDEDEILLRVARARAQTSLSSKPNSDEDERKERGMHTRRSEHQCGSNNCSQFNCPNFV